MIADHKNHDDLDEVNEADEFEATGSPQTTTANVGETSVEINVEELIAELEADCGAASGSSETDPRKRLEQLLEERRAARELKEIDEFALDLLD